MMTFLLVIAGVVLWLPIHAYGMGRYERAVLRGLEPFDPAKIEHEYPCKRRYEYAYPDAECNGKCVRIARAKWRAAAGLTSVRRWGWFVAWPMDAAFRAGQKGGAPVLTRYPDEVQRAMDVLDEYLASNKDGPA